MLQALYLQSLARLRLSNKVPEDLANFGPCNAEGYKSKGLFSEVDMLLSEDMDVLESLSQIFDPHVVSYR